MHHRLSQRVLRAALCGLLLLPASPTTYTARGAEPGEGTSHGSSTAMRQDAVRTLPTSKLTQQGRALATRVLNDVTIFRRLPSQVIECDAEMFEFLVENPDVVIKMWEVLGVTKVTMKRVGPSSFSLDDGHGTTATIHYLYRSPSHHVCYCEGSYSGALLARPIRGSCILSLRSAAVRDAEDRSYVQCRLDAFLHIDNLGAEMVARTFQNMLGNIADHNFRETTGFAAKVSEAAEETPDNIHRIAAKLDGVPAETKQRFTTIGDRIGAAALGMSPDGGPLLSPAGGAKTAARPGELKK